MRGHVRVIHRLSLDYSAFDDEGVSGNLLGVGLLKNELAECTVVDARVAGQYVLVGFGFPHGFLASGEFPRVGLAKGITVAQLTWHHNWVETRDVELHAGHNAVDL